MKDEFMFVSKITLRFAAEGEETKYRATWNCRRDREKIVTQQGLQKSL